jgi:hypothetical protein
MMVLLWAWLISTGVLIVIGAIGTMVSYAWRGDWTDKKARRIVRNWSLVMLGGVTWPIALPAVFVWYISRAVKYAYPSELER